MSYLSPSMILVVFATCLSLVGPEESGVLPETAVEWADESSVGNDVQFTFDRARNVARVASLLNRRPIQDGWQLGVHADETRTGMLITSVVRGSAADRAGLHRGDRILAVGNERVGLIGNRAASMRKVLRRQADFQGDVLLLVKRRNRGLTNITVRLGGAGRPQFFTN